jgi:phosphomevalonate kinase
MDVTTSAPGKLFLFGEYGVLAGGWSVVAAVDCRVIARREATSSHYEALGADLEDATALPRAVLAQLGESTCSLDQLSTDIRQLFAPSSSEKLGLGSSAASTVALTAACLLDPDTAFDPKTALDLDLRRQIFKDSFAAHRQLQGGRGSCADVAASVFGDIVGYRLREPCEPFAGCAGADLARTQPAHKPLALDPAEVISCPPLPIRVEPIWLGQPAVSTSFVGRCEQALRRDPARVQATLCRSSELAAMAIEALRRSDSSRLLELVALADATLDELGELIQAPIVTDAHRTLREHASRYGVRVKPSGAGGGDFSLAFGLADAEWESFLEELPQGLRHMPMLLGAGGVCRIE